MPIMKETISSMISVTRRFCQIDNLDGPFKGRDAKSKRSILKSKDEVLPSNDLALDTLREFKCKDIK
jgi:hypothetical protein